MHFVHVVNEFLKQLQVVSLDGAENELAVHIG